MEGLQPLHRRVAGIDVHRTVHVVTLLVEQGDGRVERMTHQFGGFRRDCRALAAWPAESGVELVDGIAVPNAAREARCCARREELSR